MDGAFKHNRQIGFDGQTGEVLRVAADPPTIAYSYEAYFLQSPDLKLLSQRNVDRLLSTALSEPVNNVLVESLSTNLDRSNPFSKTTKVMYKLEMEDRPHDELEDEFGVPGSAVALLIVGILLGILGLGMILIRRRRFRRSANQFKDVYDLVSLGPNSKSYDSDPAELPNGGVREDTGVWQWSMPSGHDGTCKSPKSAASEMGVQNIQ